MSTKNGLDSFKKLFDTSDSKEILEFEINMLSLTFLNEIEKEADLLGYSRKDLASKVGTSASYITQLFRGNKIPNLKILVALGLAVNKKFNINAVEDVQLSRIGFEEYNSGEKFDSTKLGRMHICHNAVKNFKKSICKVS